MEPKPFQFFPPNDPWWAFCLGCDDKYKVPIPCQNCAHSNENILKWIPTREKYLKGFFNTADMGEIARLHAVFEAQFVYLAPFKISFFHSSTSP